MKTFLIMASTSATLRGHGDERKTTCPQCSAKPEKIEVSLPQRQPRQRCMALLALWLVRLTQKWRAIQGAISSDQTSLPQTHGTCPSRETWSHKSGSLGADSLGDRPAPWDYADPRAIFEIEDEADAIAFPYYRQGELVNVKYRSLEGKYFRMAPGSERILYGVDDYPGRYTPLV